MNARVLIMKCRNFEHASRPLADFAKPISGGDR